LRLNQARNLEESSSVVENNPLALMSKLALSWLLTQVGKGVKIKRIEEPEPHPLFVIVCGTVESWEDRKVL
jgi:hypothetical protein